MANKTINQYPEISQLQLNDVVLGYDTTNNITVKIPVSTITTLVSGGGGGGGTVDASSIAAAGGILDSQFTGSGYVKKTGTQTFVEVCTIPYSDISGTPSIPTSLGSLNNVAVTTAANNQFLRYNGSTWTPVSISTSGGGGPISLDDLTNVSAPSPTNLS